MPPSIRGSELVRMPERRERHFAGKVNAFNAGYARLKDVPYDVIRRDGRRHFLRTLTSRSCWTGWRRTRDSVGQPPFKDSST
jgi:hypothetical protein